MYAVCYVDIQIKWCVFNACALSLLLYGSECWTSLQSDIRRLSSFHMRCICSVLGITWAQAWAEHTSNAELLALWSDTKTIEEKLACLTHTPLWLVTNITCSLLSALFAIGLLLAPVIGLGTKCLAERARPVSDQKGAQHCHYCDRWFRRRVEWLSLL